MATLEYANTNSKTAYPFIDGVVSAHTPYVTPGFLVDFQFVDRTNLVKSVYIGRITNAIGGNLVFYFNDSTTTSLLITLTVAAANAVNHIGNTTASFVSTSSADYSVKVVFGPKVASIISANFDTTYLAAETTFSPATVVLYHPVVTELDCVTNFITGHMGPVTAKSYGAGASVLLVPGANLDTILANGDLSAAIFQRAGSGLYDHCPDGTDLATINKASPDANGNFFISTDNCYSNTILTETDLTLYSANLATYSGAGIPFLPGATFLIQNNCSAKCPPESLNALADYINRLRDGVQELYFYASTAPSTFSPYLPKQTTGIAAATTSGSPNFTASSFSTVTTNFMTALGFVKYFHEGYSITITYSTGVTQTANIVSVLSSNEVVLDANLSTTTLSGVATFVVNDLGVYDLLTAAIAQYNAEIAPSLNVPYGQIIYTTTEGVNAVSEYGTFISVVAAIYNPTNTTINFSVNFSPSGLIDSQSGTYKRRTSTGAVTVDPTFPSTLACKDYTTVEEVFFLPCLPNTGTIDVSITSDWSGPTLTVVNGYKTLAISSTDCSTSGSDVVEVETATYGTLFTHDAPLPIGALSGTISVNVSTLPSWITSYDGTMPPAIHTFSGTPTDTTNTDYLVTSTIFAGGITEQYDLIIKSIGLPVVTDGAPSAPIGDPFVYPTTGSIATNSPTYTASGLAGTGLSIDSATGVITGTPLISALGTVSAGITATNAAGTGTGTITITVGYAPPVIQSSLAQYPTVGVPFSYQILATNSPVGTTYSATSLGGTGLSINTSTGVISGTPTTVSTVSSVIGVSAPGGSTSATLVLHIAALPPTITSATSVTGEIGTAFTYTIIAPTATSYPAVSGLPPGITQTGAVLAGTPTGTANTYNVTISAANGGGTGTATLHIVITSSLPVITSNLNIGIVQGASVTYQIVATNSPSNYSQSGIPTGLALNTTTGVITGAITSSTGLYSFSISAINGSGTTTNTLNINVVAAAAPVITSSNSFNLSQGVGSGYQITATNYPAVFGLTSVAPYLGLILPISGVSGMSLNTTTGVIFGTPTTVGTPSATIYAYNSAGSDNISLTFNIAGSYPIIVSSPTFTITHGVTGTYTIVASNGPITAYGFSGPAWLTRTGNVISGIAPAAGPYSMNISATNATGTTSLTVPITAS